MIYRNRDPVAAALMAQEGPFATIFDGDREVFASHPHSLDGFYCRAAARGEERFIEVDGRAYSYKDIFQRAARLAELVGASVQPGAPVALALPAGLDWATSFIAITAAGAVAVLINTRGSGEEMAHAIATMDCRMLITDVERIDSLDGHTDLDALALIVTGTSARGMAFATIDDVGPDLPFRPVARAPQDGAIVLFTSGTTGRPKPVRIDHGALTHAIILAGLIAAVQDRRYSEQFGVEVPPERASASAATLIASPVFHFSGVMPFLRGLYFGAPLFIFSRWNVDTIFDLMEREPVSRLGFVPAMLADMLAHPRASPANLGSLLLLANGASSLDTALADRLRAAFPSIMLANTFGQTESGAWGTTICGTDYLEHPTSAGYVVPTYEMRIIRPDGTDADRDEAGEVLLRGAGIMREYVDHPEATAETLKLGWLHSGDVGQVDADGRLYIVDRLRNMIISGGENVYCAEVERVIGDHEMVAEVIAYGLPDPRLGERVAVTIVPHAEAQADAATLIAYARTRLAGYKIPRTVEIRPDPLPRTSTFKIDRARFLSERNSN